MAVILLKFSSFDFFQNQRITKNRLVSFFLASRAYRPKTAHRNLPINQQTSSEKSQFISSLILFLLLKYSGRGIVRENSPKKHPPWATFPENELPLCKPTSFSTSSIHRWIIDSSEAVFSVARLDAPSTCSETSSLLDQAEMETSWFRSPTLENIWTLAIGNFYVHVVRVTSNIFKFHQHRDNTRLSSVYRSNLKTIRRSI